MQPIQYLDLPSGQRMAFRHTAGSGPALVFLPGYMSDMDGGKAGAVAAWAGANGRACLLLDYTGCGASEGDFADATLSGWRDEILALLAHLAIGEVVLVGSSMGGWLMLLLAEALGPRARGLVGIAAAPDFTEWGRSADDKARLAAGETVFDPNPYGPEPTPLYPRFYADGQAQRRLERGVAFAGPVRLVHGQRDAEVPFAISLALADAVRSDDIQVTLVKDGDHRLSRPQDIALLLRTVADLLESLP